MALVVRRLDPLASVLAKAVNGIRTQIGAGAHFHLDASEVVPTSAASTDTPTAVALSNQLASVYKFHVADTLANQAADTTNVQAVALANPAAGDLGLAGAIALANDLKAKYNAHLTQSGVHYNNDATNTVAAANATDSASLVTLANAIRTALLAHLANATVGQSVRLVSG